MAPLLRRLPLSRLLLLCGVLLAAGIGATALASALSVGPTPPAKPLAQAVHDTLASSSAGRIEGVSARIALTDNLLEGVNLAGGSGGGGGGGLASSPLLAGGAGRLWVASDGRARIELQSGNGDTEILYDGHAASLYEPSSNTLYRWTPPPGSGETGSGAGGSGTAGPDSGAAHTGLDTAGAVHLAFAPDSAHSHEIPSVAKIEEAISHISAHATLSGAIPTDVAGKAAYTVRISPSRNGGLIGGAELSWDASTGLPLRAAIYAKGSSSPVIELTATELSYEPVPASVFEIAPPPGAKVQEVTTPKKGTGTSGQEGAGPSGPSAPGGAGRPKITTHGEGLEAIALLESPVKAGAAGTSSPMLPEGLQKVQINGASATELPTALGTLLTFERSSIRYLLAGSVTPASIEAFARSL
jgi:outer membrane lipoprotein-sorting protein